MLRNLRSPLDYVFISWLGLGFTGISVTADACKKTNFLFFFGGEGVNNIPSNIHLLNNFPGISREPPPPDIVQKKMRNTHFNWCLIFRLICKRNYSSLIVRLWVLLRRFFFFLHKIPFFFSICKTLPMPLRDALILIFICIILLLPPPSSLPLLPLFCRKFYTLHWRIASRLNRTDEYRYCRYCRKIKQFTDLGLYGCVCVPFTVLFADQGLIYRLWGPGTWIIKKPHSPFKKKKNESIRVIPFDFIRGVWRIISKNFETFNTH